MLTQAAGVVLDATVPDNQVRATILERVGRHRFDSVAAQATEIGQDRASRLHQLCARYSQLRQFAPHVLAAFEYRAADDDSCLLAAVRLLTSLNSTRSRIVPPDAPIGFAPKRWQRYLRGQYGLFDLTGLRFSSRI